VISKLHFNVQQQTRSHAVSATAELVWKGEVLDTITLGACHFELEPRRPKLILAQK